MSSASATTTAATAPPDQGGAGFGTAAVYLTSLSTILGAILFLRFGYAVGNLGFLGVAVLIAVGHMVTLPTALAVAEIATNQRVAGGGEYFILSRSFGIITGAAIGLALFLARAISVAFYVIAFAEAFAPLFQWLETSYSLVLDKRLVAVPAVFALTALLLRRGAEVGMKTLYVVVAVLALSLVLFFAGGTGYPAPPGIQALTQTTAQPDSFFFVFAICFPAFTGMTAGLGLSGDLRDPERALPVGTIAATVTGMLIYLAVAAKLAISASPEALASDQLVMSRVALWGPIIPLGLAAATVSSAIGAYLAAPRTIQAIAQDGVFPWPSANTWFAAQDAKTKEPVHATLLTGAIALVFVLAGDVDFVAQIITMFYVITYGSICLVSFLEHFAADPAYRPAFRSRWYVSLFGAAMSLWVMLQISQLYALLSIFVMFLLYLTLARVNEQMSGLSKIVQDAIFQLSRQLQVFLQKARKPEVDNWRPSVIAMSRSSFERLGAFDLLRWISHRYGFGTYVHHHLGYLSKATREESRTTVERLLKLTQASRSNVYVDTMISPSHTAAIAHTLQIPGISGKENNMVLFEFSKEEPGELAHIVDNFPLVAAIDFDVCILGTSTRGFGYRTQIHVWLTPADYENASLMILLAYILLGHPDWKHGVIKVFSVVPVESLEEERQELEQQIRSGRLPISASNVEFLRRDQGRDRKAVVNERSRDADLVILGFRGETLKRSGMDTFLGYDGVGSVLFVNTRKEIALVTEKRGESASPAPGAATIAPTPVATDPPKKATDPPKQAAEPPAK